MSRARVATPADAAERLTLEFGLSVEAQVAVSELVGELVEGNRHKLQVAARHGLSANAQLAVDRMAKRLAGEPEGESSVQPRVPVDFIQERVARSTGMTVEAMLVPRRDARRVRARHIAMYLARELNGKSYPKLAREFGKKDHTTVMHGEDVVKALRAQDATFSDFIDRLADDIVSAYARAVDGRPVESALQRAS